MVKKLMKSHFIDIDIIMETESMPWIVSKDNPNIPILKLSEVDFNIFKSGIYHKQNNKIEFNGQTFWISNDFMNKIKISCKKSRKHII